MNYFENGQVRLNGPLQAKNFGNWYYLMPEEGFSFFKIQLENLTPQKPKSPLNPANFETVFSFQTQNGHPHHLGGGGGGTMVDKAYLSYQSLGK